MANTLRDMGLVFTIFLLGVNGMVLFMTTLPSNVNATANYDFGLSSGDVNNLAENINDFEDDSNSLKSTLETYIEAKQEQKGTLSIIDKFLLGTAETVNSLLGAASTVTSLLGSVFKYFVAFIFGYFDWLDYFFNPVCAVEFGSGFCFIRDALKGFFFLIQVITMVSFILPIFVGGRTT